MSEAAQGQVKTSVTESKSIRSVEIGVRVLEALIASPKPKPLSLKDVAEHADLSRSQAHRYLSAYVNTGLVKRDERAGHYELGPFSIKLGLAAFSRLDIDDESKWAVEKLVDETNLTGLVSVWGDHGPTIIRWVHGTPPIATSLSLGSVISVLSSSAGQVFYSFTNSNRTNALVSAERANGLVPAALDLEALRLKVRKNGYSIVSDLVVPGLNAVSAPILGKDGEAAAVVGLISRGGNKIRKNSKAVKLLLEVTKMASANIGYVGR